MKDEENHDVFSEDNEAATTETSEADIGAEEGAQQEAETQGEAQSGAEGSEQQGEEGAEPPAADGDNKVQKSEKMIPESRLKAAIKDVSDKLSEAQRELATMKAQPAPDRTKDPDGYDRHTRIETSKIIMQQTVKDYDEVIAHFQEMAKAEPSLNAIVANHAAPAKMAYDLAKKDMEITELYAMKDDPDFAEFKAFKAAKAAGKAADETADTATQLAAGAKKGKAATEIPNLNRNATSVGRETKKSDSDDDLFADHYSKTG